MAQREPFVPTVSVELEDTCPGCSGSSRNYNTGLRCEECGGLGTILTPIGESLIEFIEGHLKLRAAKRAKGELDDPFEFS